MKHYLAWSLRQLYLLVFLRTQFQRKVEDDRGKVGRKLSYGQRFRYFLKMLPCLVVLVILGNSITGQVCQAIGIDFQWERSWIGVAFGVALSVAGGVAVGVAFGLAFAVPFGVSFGAAGGVGINVASGTAVSVGLGIGMGIALEADLDPDPEGGVFVGFGFGVLVGLLAGVLVGLLAGVLAGVVNVVVASLTFVVTYFRIVTFPFDVALAAICYAVGEKWPRALPRAWNWCPAAWNEVIWLPLPFLDKLLVLLVANNQQEGLRQIAFVASERPKQRRAARAALSEVAIADVEVESLTDLATVSDRLSWTTNAPTELPTELAVLPRFDRIAQQIGQYLTLANPYRQGEALDHALEEIEALQRSLISARGWVAARLLKVAIDWRRLVETERETFRLREKASRGISNPFLIGVPITEQDANIFAGRQDIKRQIEDSILGVSRPPTLLLHGSRRMGKSSVLYQLPRLLGPNFAPALIDCQDPAVRSSPTDLLGYLSSSLREGLQRRSVTVPPLSTEALHRNPYPAFGKWMDEVERLIPIGLRPLLCLDEYDRLQTIMEKGWGTDFLDFLRHRIQHHPRVVMLFTGVRTFEEQGPAWTDRFINVRRVRVSFLRREDLIPLLTKPIPEFDMTYAPGALDAILDATNGHPYLTQAVAFELVQFLNEQQRKEATCADVETAAARALEAGGEYFANVWYDAGEEGQAVLVALARGDSLPDHPRARTWLREHDVLNDVGTFAVPLVETWVKKKRSG